MYEEDKVPPIKRKSYTFRYLHNRRECEKSNTYSLFFSIFDFANLLIGRRYTYVLRYTYVKIIGDNVNDD